MYIGALLRFGDAETLDRLLIGNEMFTDKGWRSQIGTYWATVASLALWHDVSRGWPAH